MNDICIYIVLGILVFSSLLTAMIRNALKAVIALVVASASLTIFIFLMGAPLAAVFELSVCAGLITAIFISTISLTHYQASPKGSSVARKRIARYIYLPVIILIVIVIILFVKPAINIMVAGNVVQEPSVQHVIWNSRMLDLAGQIVIILAGVFGVVILFKEGLKK